MDHRAEVRQLRLSLVAAALDVARELEAGRAQTPFQDQLTQQLSAAETLPVRAAILASSPEMARALLGDFLGTDYNVCKVVVPSRLGYSEVLLQERGFLLDAGGGAREFDDAGAFVEALQQAHALESRSGTDLEPLRVKLKGPAHLSGLCLLIPQDLAALAQKPALLSLIASQADWVFLAGESTMRLTADQRQTVQLVLENVTGVQHVLMTTDEPATPAPAEAWWKNWRTSLSLGLVRQGSEQLRHRLSLLTAPESELRLYLVERRLGGELATTLTLMEQELQQNQRSLGNRLQLTREGLVGSANNDLRKATEPVRARLTEEFDQLLKAVERETKAALAPDGALSRCLRDAAQALSASDIEQTTADNSIKLSLHPQTNERLVALTEAAARQHLAAGYRTLADGVDCSLRDAENALERALGPRHRLASDMPSEAELWETTRGLDRPEIRYRGEMPKPTLASRFSSARQSIMSLMILGTLLSGAAAFTGGDDSGGLRTTLYGLMLPLLVVGFLWTYVSYRRKEQLTLEKEVEKLQDGVYTELRRAVQELLREQQSVVNNSLQRVQRAVVQQVDAALDRMQQQRQGEADEQRRRQSEQQRSVEQRLGRLRTLAQQVGGLRPRLTQNEKLQSQWLAAWISKFNQPRE